MRQLRLALGLTLWGIILNSSTVPTSTLSPIIPEPFSSDEDFKTFLNSYCRFSKKGTSRKVYLINDSNLILKVAIRKNTIVCNWTEITAYHWAKDKSSLASVSSWSNSGRYLVMEKLEMTNRQHKNFIWPPWVTDQKQSNIGTDKFGKCKICDYALVKQNPSPLQSPFV